MVVEDDEGDGEQAKSIIISLRSLSSPSGWECVEI